ncbi:MAG: GNAT family N-acetyltransferase [Bacteroidetes bacterium]|nr:GNAT family N-acetyltransferase [Bacteroidota bacterium]
MTAPESILYRREVGDGIVVVNTQPEHVVALEELQKIVFPTLHPTSLMRREHYLNHIRIFQDGQFVALYNDRVIGMTTSIRYHLTTDSFHTFNDVLDGGFLNTHEPNGEWLYGMDIGTHPDFRGKGIATYLYDARQSTVHKLSLEGQFTYGMLSGYGAVQKKMSAEEYYQKVIHHELKDPTVSRQMKNGFTPHGLVAGYVDDPVCAGYCAFLIRKNELLTK